MSHAEAPRHIRSLKTTGPGFPELGPFLLDTRRFKIGRSRILKRNLIVSADCETTSELCRTPPSAVRLDFGPSPPPRWGRFLKGAVNGVVNHPFAGAAWRPSAQTPGAIYPTQPCRV